MLASLPIVIRTLLTSKKKGLLVTTIKEIVIKVATREVDIEEKVNLPVGEGNPRTGVNLMKRRMTQCGHTVGTLILPVAAPPKTAQRSTRAAKEWGVA